MSNSKFASWAPRETNCSHFQAVLTKHCHSQTLASGSLTRSSTQHTIAVTLYSCMWKAVCFSTFKLNTIKPTHSVNNNMNLDTSSQEPHKLTPMEGLSVLSNQIYPCQSVVSLCCRLTLVLGELAFLKFFLKLYLGSWRDGLVLAEDQCSIPNTLMKVHNCPKTSYKIGKMWKSIGLFFFCRFPPSLPGCFT